MLTFQDLRGYAFGTLEGNRRDLSAVNIQRGREEGVLDYNSVRDAYGLSPVANVSSFNFSDPAAAQAMFDVYGNKVEDIDLWVGGIMESGPRGPGPLFASIMMEQFLRIRDGDRFWYANKRNK